MTPDAFYKHIADREFSSLYLFYGEDEFLIDRAVRSLSEAVFRDDDAALNKNTFWGDEPGAGSKKRLAADITATSNEFPLLAERRMVLVKDAEKVVTTEPLSGYIQNPSPSTVLVLIEGDSRGFDKKKVGSTEIIPFFKTLETKRKAVIVEFKIKEEQVPRWIAGEAARMGKTISSEACETLVRLKGIGLRDISMELEKLIVAAPEKPDISTEDVLFVVGASRSYNLYELGNAVMERNTVKALQVAQNVLESTKATAIVSDLFRQLTLVWKARTYDPAKRTDEEKTLEDFRLLGFISRWQYDIYRRYTSNFPDLEYFETCFEHILEADLALKTSSNLDDAGIITRLIYQLTK